MSNPTSNFGWQMPTPTDLVTDLPADFEVFGQAVDSSMADLKGGTTGQILSKATNTDMDFVWITNDQGDITGITATSPLTGGGTSGAVTVGIQSATTSQSGAVQLSDSTSTTSSVLASTPTATKAAYDLANTANTTANAAISKSTVTGKGSIVAATASSTPAQLAVGNNGETLVCDSSTSTGLRYQAPKVANAAYNSSFDVWQRGVSFTGASPYYTADRWVGVRSGGTTGSTYSRQSASLTGFTYSLRAQRDSGNTGTNALQFGQSLETADSTRFAGKTVTFSFYAKAGANYSPTSNFLIARVDSGTGTDQQYWVSGFTGAASVVSSSVTLTTSWQRFSITGTVSSSATEISFGFSASVTGTAGANDWFEITGVQLEEGSVATPYNRMSGSIQGELAACQRYYERFSSATSGFLELGQSVGRGNGQIDFLLRFATTKRITPTAVDYSGTINCATYYGGTALTVSSLVLDTPSSPWGGDLLMTMSSSATAGQRYMTYFNNNSTSYIGFSAEL